MKILNFLKDNWIIVTIIIILILIIIWYIYFRNKNEETINEVSNNGFPISFGSSGENVILLQNYLKSKGENLGLYGPNKDGIDAK